MARRRLLPSYSVTSTAERGFQKRASAADTERTPEVRHQRGRKRLADRRRCNSSNDRQNLKLESPQRAYIRPERTRAENLQPILLTLGWEVNGGYCDDSVWVVNLRTVAPSDVWENNLPVGLDLESSAFEPRSITRDVESIIDTARISAKAVIVYLSHFLAHFAGLEFDPNRGGHDPRRLRRTLDFTCQYRSCGTETDGCGSTIRSGPWAA
jgi:hypothetical protein